MVGHIAVNHLVQTSGKSTYKRHWIVGNNCYLPWKNTKKVYWVTRRPNRFLFMGLRHSREQWHDLASFIDDSLQQPTNSQSHVNYSASRQLVLVPMMVDTHRPNKRPCPWNMPIEEARQVLQLDANNTELREEVKRIKVQLTEVLEHLNELRPKPGNVESNKAEVDKAEESLHNPVNTIKPLETQETPL